MMKKKLTAMVAVLLACLLLFPTAAFAYASDGETAPTETPAAQSADAVPPADTTETVGNTEQADEPESNEDTTLPFDTDVLTTLLAGMDPEILEVLKEHPKLIAMLLPTLHVTVREGSVTISIDKQDQDDPGRIGTVTTQGGNLNVRTGPSTGYVCGEYLRVNDIPSTPTDDGYTFDIDQATILSFLELLQGMVQPAETQAGHGLTPSGNLTLVDERDLFALMEDDEILKIIIEFREDSHERDDRDRDEAV